MNNKKEIKLTLSIDETNSILDALGQQPFVKVFGLIEKIQQQANQQLNKMEVQTAPVKSFSKSESDDENESTMKK